MAQLPTPKSKILYIRSAVLTGLLPAICALGLSILLALRLYAGDEGPLQAIATMTFAVIIAISSLITMTRQAKREQQIIALDEPSILRAHARQVNKKLREHLNISQSDDGKIRVTVHKVIWNADGESPRELVQLLRYSGGRGGPHRRKFSVRSGIIGLTARTRDLYVASRDPTAPDAAYRDQLVAEWGFTWDEARQRLGDRRAWIAAPLLDERVERVIGVLYADSDEPDAFDSVEIQEIFWTQTQTLAEIVHETYGRGSD